MTILRFDNGQDFFEMSIAIEEAPALPSRGDAYVTVQVQSAGFAGRNDLWVLSSAMSEFCRGLVQLERSLRGEAVLESVSPNELKLKVRSVTLRGHVAVEGETGYSIRRDNTQYWHSVSFGFEFESTQLAGAVALPWVGRYTG